jgi:hypothetical protein
VQKVEPEVEETSEEEEPSEDEYEQKKESPYSLPSLQLLTTMPLEIIFEASPSLFFAVVQR